MILPFMSLERVSGSAFAFDVRQLIINTASQLTRLIRTPVKRLFLHDTSSSALGSFTFYQNASSHSYGRRKYRILDVDFTRGRYSRGVKTYSCLSVSERGRYCRGSAILQKDFALGNQTESLK